MKFLFNLFASLLAIIAIACSDNSPSQVNNAESELADTIVIDSVPAEMVEKPDCEIEGKVLEGNQFWYKAENEIIVISANKETEDPELGDSHRMLEVLDGKSCKHVFRQILPVNSSPDFPYYLSEITYNNLSKIIAIRGFDKLFVFDLVNKRLAGPLNPSFLNERFYEDAHSSMITRIEVWENYLIGNTSSVGAFVYDLSNPSQPKPVLAAAEYEIEKGVRYNSLFILKSSGAEDKVQLFLPMYDGETDQFSINPLFSEPKKVNTNINKSFRNNRYLVLKEILSQSESLPLAIDMSKNKLVDLPDDIAKKKDTEIIEWLKNR